MSVPTPPAPSLSLVDLAKAISDPKDVFLGDVRDMAAELLQWRTLAPPELPTINIADNAPYYHRADGSITTNRSGGSYEAWPLVDLLRDLEAGQQTMRRLAEAIHAMLQRVPAASPKP